MENKVLNYYDGFKTRQIKTGVNSRHRIIISSLRKAGLKKHHKVWEIGCGIGIISGILSKIVRKGSVVGVDLSPESIEFAKHKYQLKTNLTFIASDILDFKTEATFDVIVMPDVLEHIPIEQHDKIFAKVKQHINPNGILFINIPTSNYLEYLAKNKPEDLQIIDQPIESNEIINNIEKYGFQLFFFKTYSLFIDNFDYRMMVFKLKDNYNSVNYINGYKKIIRELKSRFSYYFAK